ncbi:hypothetical protein NEOLEDRAFT_1203695 [Neolentinus lepideus HHB14362 ss-1]|uniref:Uncharacterized protein n=1 Tax=Neolentinus lepideus HHB14362 ss-1 TaxID=1314782 RepID=A0A165SNP4_9AGAM|nr:hypothetical protein NEOLEDRAFT_1203695 [Neolentinus lepideus HHB14362 ss-1]
MSGEHPFVSKWGFWSISRKFVCDSCGDTKHKLSQSFPSPQWGLKVLDTRSRYKHRLAIEQYHTALHQKSTPQVCTDVRIETRMDKSRNATAAKSLINASWISPTTSKGLEKSRDNGTYRISRALSITVKLTQFSIIDTLVPAVYHTHGVPMAGCMGKHQRGKKYGGTKNVPDQRRISAKEADFELTVISESTSERGRAREARIRRHEKGDFRSLGTSAIH